MRFLFNEFLIGTGLLCSICLNCPVDFAEVVLSNTREFAGELRHCCSYISRCYCTLSFAHGSHIKNDKWQY